MRVCVVIGRGFNYATAFETAVKIKELSYVLAEPYSSADFLHGPVALIEEAFPTLVIAPLGAMQNELEQFVRELNVRGAEVIAISDVPKILELARIPLPLRATAPEWASPIVSIVAGQFLAMHLANVRDYDVDRPRGLPKSNRNPLTPVVTTLVVSLFCKNKITLSRKFSVRCNHRNSRETKLFASTLSWN